MLRKLLIVALFLIIYFISSAPFVQASIFDSGRQGSSGVFGNFQRQLDSLFDGLFGTSPGGSVIPGLSPTPTIDPASPPVGAGSLLPPSADAVKQLKLTMEWDTLSVGGEGPDPVFEDMLEDLHVPLLFCPDCAGAAAAFDTLRRDEKNRLIPARSSSPAVAGEFAQAPIGEVCPNQNECHVAGIERVLYGWCGQPPILINASRVPAISIDSPGPNQYTLPNAISNKYIRRDGYAFRCVSECNDFTCATDNYVEFQTEIFASNAFSYDLKVENPTELSIENVFMEINGLTYDPNGEYAMPHNLDFPFEPASAEMESLFQISGYSYGHGSTLTQKIDMGLGPLRIVNGIQMSLRRSPEDINVAQMTIGPFDIAANTLMVFPIQPPATEFTAIPDTVPRAPTSARGGLNAGTANPGTPGGSGGSGGSAVAGDKPNAACECKQVRLHNSKTQLDCNAIVTNPSIDQCRLYYGIGIPKNAGPTHAGGYVCNQTGITVPGCPPPWCFERLPEVGGFTGPMTDCPGGLIPLPSSNNWWSQIDYSNIIQGAVPPEEESLRKMKNFLSEWLPIIDYAEPESVAAFGCSVPCKDEPPPEVTGVGGIVPRDFNFICDPQDLDASGVMLEEARCLGTDPEVLIKPTDPRFFTYRDVSGIGGCGYNASSNNSIVGPIQVNASYGGEGENRASRSVVIGSIPIGGRLVDDQARPYGWPMTGIIDELWGYTSLAESNPGRANPTQEYGEYRLCPN
jgi:hypothetical protein